jgi:uncharacterized membrane protein HdeD (DUF308 family)
LMSEAAKMRSVVFLGLLFLMSGTAGVAVGHASAAAGWWLICVGLVLAVLGWRRLRDSSL